MIAFIRGTVAAYGNDWIVVENSGIGWHMAYPHVENLRLNTEVSVYTYMHVSENDVALFGFESQEEKELFLRLIDQIYPLCKGGASVIPLSFSIRPFFRLKP